MSLKCVLVKSGTCSIIASMSHVVVSVVQDTQAAAALFDVGGCFEALSEHKEGRGFFLVQAVHLITPLDTDTNTRAGIRIHLHTFICTKTCTDFGMPSCPHSMQVIHALLDTLKLLRHALFAVMYPVHSELENWHC